LLPPSVSGPRMRYHRLGWGARHRTYALSPEGVCYRVSGRGDPRAPPPVQLNIGARAAPYKECWEIIFGLGAKSLGKGKTFLAVVRWWADGLRRAAAVRCWSRWRGRGVGRLGLGDGGLGTCRVGDLDEFVCRGPGVGAGGRRSSRRTRSRCRSLVAQFPGYLFVRSSQLETVQHERWGLRPLTLGGAQATVTEEQVSHALALEARSRLSALPRGRARTLVPGDRVVLVDGPLLLDPHAPPLGVVTEVRDRHLVVLLDGATLPVLCAHDAVSPE
jgi:hypothetical protein